MLEILLNNKYTYGILMIIMSVPVMLIPKRHWFFRMVMGIIAAFVPCALLYHALEDKSILVKVVNMLEMGINGIVGLIVLMCCGTSKSTQLIEEETVLDNVDNDIENTEMLCECNTNDCE